MYSDEYKKQVYKKFIDNGRIFYHIDKSKEPTAEERQIILELGKRENTKVKRDIELEQSKKKFDKLYAENQGKIKRDFPKTIFDLLKKRRDHRDD